MSDGLGGPSPVDDEMQRWLRELTEEMPGTSRIREPSAAEREKAGKKQSKARAREARARARASRPGRKRRAGSRLVGGGGGHRGGRLVRLAPGIGRALAARMTRKSCPTARCPGRRRPTLAPGRQAERRAARRPVHRHPGRSLGGRRGGDHHPGGRPARPLHCQRGSRRLRDDAQAADRAEPRPDDAARWRPDGVRRRAHREAAGAVHRRA